MDMRYDGLDSRLYGVGLQRGALFSILDAAWEGRPERLQPGCEIVDVDAEAGLLHDACGDSHGPFDLVVVADGAASTLRSLVAPPSVDRPYPWGALWCLLPAGSWPHVAELRQRYVAARKMIGLLPVGGRPDDPTRRLSFFWSLRTDAFAQWEADGLAPWMDELHRLWPEARDVFAHLTDPAQLARARYRDTIMKCWHRGRVVLVGDCAHAMSPQLGQGVNMALLDAEALTAVLRDAASLEAALPAYQRERRAHVWIYQLWSRWLTPVFQSERDAVAKMRDLAFRPMGRLPGGRGQMLRVLTGTQRGLVGRLGLEEAFVDSLGQMKTADIQEMCANSIEHANSDKRKKNWLFAVYYDVDKVIFTMTDIGEGILSTLKKKAVQLFQDAISFKDEVLTLDGIFDKKYQSSTLNY